MKNIFILFLVLASCLQQGEEPELWFNFGFPESRFVIQVQSVTFSVIYHTKA